jgi:hypothetical protein
MSMQAGFRWSNSLALAFAGLIGLSLIGSLYAAGDSVTGRVAKVQLIEISGFDDDGLLILSLEEGHGFLIPGQRNLPASSGVEVRVNYFSGEGPEDLPVACRVQVTAVPVDIDGEEILQPASRPFEVYRNPDARCGDV